MTAPFITPVIAAEAVDDDKEDAADADVAELARDTDDADAAEVLDSAAA